MPGEAEGVAVHPADISGIDGLPPHRAAIPLAPVMLDDALRPRRSLPVASIVVAVALHCGFLAAALIWGQGGALPPPERAISVELVDRIVPPPPPKQPLEHLAKGAAQFPDKEARPAKEFAAVADAFEAATAPEIARASEPPATQPAADAAPEPAALPPTTAEPERASIPPEAVTVSAGLAMPAAGEAALAGVVNVEAAQPAPPPAVSGQPLPAAAAAVVAEADPSPTAIVTADAPPAGTYIVPPLPAAAPRPLRAAMTAATTPEDPAAPDTALPSPASRGAMQARRSAQGIAAAIFRRRVKSRIQRNAPYGNFGPGRLVVGLRLSRSGRLVSAVLLKSSGNPDIDRAALRCVRTAGPYPAPPPGATAAERAMPVSFRFQ